MWVELIDGPQPPSRRLQLPQGGKEEKVRLCLLYPCKLMFSKELATSKMLLLITRKIVIACKYLMHAEFQRLGRSKHL